MGSPNVNGVNLINVDLSYISPLIISPLTPLNHIRCILYEAVYLLCSFYTLQRHDKRHLTISLPPALIRLTAAQSRYWFQIGTSSSEIMPDAMWLAGTLRSWKHMRLYRDESGFIFWATFRKFLWNSVPIFWWFTFAPQSQKLECVSIRIIFGVWFTQYDLQSDQTQNCQIFYLISLASFIDFLSQTFITVLWIKSPNLEYAYYWRSSHWILQVCQVYDIISLKSNVHKLYCKL